MSRLTKNFEKLDTASWTAAAGITEDQAQEQTQKWWKYAFQKAKDELEQINKNTTAAAYRDRHVKVPFGEEVARFSAREYFWLMDNYGPGFDDDLDFLMCYRKYRDQNFLATPSKEIFS